MNTYNRFTADLPQTIGIELLFNSIPYLPRGDFYSQIIWKRIMSLLHVKQGSSHEPIDAGVYQATLTEVIGPEESDYGQRYRFVFEDGKRTYIGFADLGKSGPSTKNKLGQWLCALEGKPPQEMDVDPTKYIGKKYMVVYGPNKNGTIALTTFTPMA